MIKVLYMIHSLHIGGTERQFVELIRGVRRLDNIEPHVCYFEEYEHGYKDQLADLGSWLTLIERKGKYDLSLFRQLHRYVSENSIDLIHSFHTLAGLIAVVYGSLAGVPVIASTIRNSKDTSWKNCLSIRIQAFLAKRLLANSHAGFMNRFKKIRKNFRVIYNGIDFDRFKISDDDIYAIRNQYELNKFDFVVSMIASLNKNKDHDTFIRAIPAVLRCKPKTFFFVAGDGSERQRLEKKVADLSLEGNVIFTGYINNVHGLLANTTVSVLMTNTDRCMEGISNSLLESMTSGVPVIASRGGGTNELVADGVNGMLIAPYNAEALAESIIKILDNPCLQKALGEAGKKTVATEFGYERYIHENVGLYNEALGH